MCDIKMLFRILTHNFTRVRVKLETRVPLDLLDPLEQE